MVKLTTKEDVALLVEEAFEMFEETGCVPDVEGKKVRAETIVPCAKRYILETIDNPTLSASRTCRAHSWRNRWIPSLSTRPGRCRCRSCRTNSCRRRRRSWAGWRAWACT